MLGANINSVEGIESSCSTAVCTCFVNVFKLFGLHRDNNQEISIQPALPKCVLRTRDMRMRESE